MENKLDVGAVVDPCAAAIELLILAGMKLELIGLAVGV
jgi:hypothetical protein